MPDMVRNPVAVTVQVGTSEANSSSFPFHDCAGGFIHIPSAETAPTLTFYVADSEDASPLYNQAHDKDGSLISLSAAASKAYEINPSLFGALRLKIVASAISSGTSVAYKLVMKS